MYYWVYLILSVIGIFCGIIFLLKETNRSKSFFRENVRDFASLSRKTKKMEEVFQLGIYKGKF